MPGPNELLTVAQVAELKGVPEDTVRRRIQRKVLPARKQYNIWFVKRKDAEAWIVRRGAN
jgi:excisionase family DNA binding protein